MTSLETAPAAPNTTGAHSSAAPGRTWTNWIPFALFSLVWLDLIRLLSTQWEAREQYAYGWFVPIFAAALFFRRWQDRPDPVADNSSFATHPLGLGFLFRSVCFVGLALLLPLRVIYEINTDWPLIAWLYTGITVLVSLYAVFRYGGWRWVLHFAFPVCFILVAVVWPYRIEKGLTQGLMRVVASLTVELLGWMNIPALQHGNLIELSTGTVGVDEACSGIRSFQSSLMAGLLMGELYRMRLHWRAVLVISGLVIGFCLNVCRTLLLSWQASKEGLSAIDKWHDPAGMTITVLCFFFLWGLAVFLRRWTAAETPTSEMDSISAPSASGYRAFGPSAPRFLALVGAWAILCIAATEVWYRSHSNPNAGQFYWSAALPENDPTFENIEMAPRTLKLLKFDDGASGKWQAEGAEWQAFFFRWKPRSIESVINSRTHRPEVCLTAAGLRQESVSEPVAIEAQGFEIPFRKYVFSSTSQTFHVFFAQWEDGNKDQAGMQASNQQGRLHSVLGRRRLVGQQTLEIIVSGYPSLADAEMAVRNRLSSLIKRDQTVARD